MATKRNSTTPPPVSPLTGVHRVRIDLWLTESDLAVIGQHMADMQAHIDSDPHNPKYGKEPWSFHDSLRAMFSNGLKAEGGK